MSVYASTFISGLQEPISELLLQQIPDARIQCLFDGLLIYNSNAEIDIIKKVKFFNNTYTVLKKFDNLSDNPIEHMLRNTQITKDIQSNIIKGMMGNKQGFRIVLSKENNLVAVNNELLKHMESKIAKVPGLIVDRFKPDLEFWFLYRSERIGLFMLRLTKHTSYEKLLNKGELRPELSYALCAISEPNQHDIFLDPFCGYGSIPIVRSSMFPANMLFASDIDEDKVKKLKQKLKLQKNKKPIFLKHADALHLSSFEDEFIDKIVTDPPWGIYEDLGMDISDFYHQMMQEFYRILKVKGIVVVLTAKKSEFENVLFKCKDKFDLRKKYDILVSGKKASIYKAVKLK